MLCNLKLNHCCCWRSNKSEDVSDEEKKDAAPSADILKADDQAITNGNDENDDDYDEGNPRNKVALQPGHSLMDWIRLGASGKDLTGLGAKAGTFAVTKQELAKHNKKDDAWLAIRGKVYNVTEYFSFHPGGEEELTKGAGIDATTLFDQVHSWVNYEQILQKCYVGRLVAIDPTIDTESLFLGTKSSASVSQAGNRLEVTSANSLGTSIKSQLKSGAGSREPSAIPPPRFDWIQKMEYITVIFYTKAFSNPLVEVNCPLDEQTVVIFLAYEDHIFKNELIFYERIRWPCDVSLTVETGKVELVFKKSDGAIWDNYGILRQQCTSTSNDLAVQTKTQYILRKNNAINHNTWLLKYDRKDGKIVVFPIGQHVKVFGNLMNGEEISRSYTPIPECLFDNFLPHSNKTSGLCLMIKRYDDGLMSRLVTDKNIGDEIQITRPLRRFDLRTIEKKETTLMLAAGTGITPMLGLILYLLERRIRKSQFVRLLFFNRTEKDILFRSQFEDLQLTDPRFKVDHILSEADYSWNGLKGHINSDMVSPPLKEHLQDTGYTIQDIFAFVCGPPKFNSAAVEVLQSISITKEQIHVFEG